MTDNTNITPEIKAEFREGLIRSREVVPDDKIRSVQLTPDGIQDFKAALSEVKMTDAERSVLLSRIVKLLKDRPGITKTAIMQLAGYSDHMVKKYANSVVIEAVRELGVDKEMIQKAGRIKSMLDGASITDSLLGSVLHDALYANKHMSGYDSEGNQTLIEVPDHKFRLEAAKLVLELNRLMPKTGEDDRPSTIKIEIVEGGMEMGAEWKEILSQGGQKELTVDTKPISPE